MLPTPTTNNVDIDKVYEPYEDSFLLLDALEQDSDYINSLYAKGSLVVEVGTGSGIVTTFIQQNLLKNGLFLTTDINIHACVASLATSAENGGSRYLDSIRTDLTAGLRPHLVDVLVFNPPYVPNEHVPTRPETDDDDKWIYLALEGGKDGMEVTNRLLDCLDEILAPRGTAYILFCERNKPIEVARRVMEAGWQSEAVIQRRAGWEVLSVWKFTRCQQDLLRKPEL
jgi:release factor glutamine methyltransferase